MLGGRAAEEVVLGEVSTGAANDFQQATEMAERMVKEYGMSERLGLVARREGRGGQFIGMPTGDKEYSEQTAREIDEEVARLIQDSYQRAKDLLKEQLPALEKIVEVLFEKEVMDGEELRRLLGIENGREGETVGGDLIEGERPGAGAGGDSEKSPTADSDDKPEGNPESPENGDSPPLT